jgi:hypothetical protein
MLLYCTGGRMCNLRKAEDRRVNFLREKFPNLEDMDPNIPGKMRVIKEALVKSGLYSGTTKYLNDNSVYNLVLKAKGIKPLRHRASKKVT